MCSSIISDALPVSPVQLLIDGCLALLALTLMIICASVLFRYWNRRYEARLDAWKDRLYPHIIDYIDGVEEAAEIRQMLDERRITVRAFKQTIFDLLPHIKGREAERLQDLLMLPEIFDYHARRVRSIFPYVRIWTYNYFSYVRLEKGETIQHIKSDLNHDKQIIAFAAASALMASTDVSVRCQALEHILLRPRISQMAVREMLHKFHHPEAAELEAETECLQTLIDSNRYPAKNIAPVIRGAAEIGYFELATLFYDKLKNSAPYWKQSEVLSALIEALGTFSEERASPQIRAYTGHPSAEVRKACVNALSELPSSENYKALSNLVFDEDFRIRYQSLNALLNSDEEGQQFLRDAIRQNPERSATLQVESMLEQIEAYDGLAIG